MRGSWVLKAATGGRGPSAVLPNIQ